LKKDLFTRSSLLKNAFFWESRRGRPGARGAHYKNIPIFGKIRGGPGGPLQKMPILEGWKGKAWGPEGSPSTKRPFFERIARGGPGAHYKKKLFM
jgi:hypothetical protein